MLLTLAHIGPRASKTPIDALTRSYVDRIEPYYACLPEAFPTEAGFLAWLARPTGRSGRPAAAPYPVLLDSRGRAFSSSDLAYWIGNRRDGGTQHLVFAIGGPDGWSPAALDVLGVHRSGGLLLSFGPITLPHELARLVLAEQLYRACTILAGHPYHSGH